MRIVRQVAELQIDRTKKVGLVPTMGAFHEGHLQLMRRSVEDCETTVVSLFVNPTQFGKGEDFERYPRNEEDDARMAESVGVDILFMPTVQEVYPREPMSTVLVPEVGDRWEGEHRPGHFNGVSTVVAKLFNMVRPDMAFFGRKDFQQCAVIRRMVEDLNIPLELRFEPTFRESDGLAMSSRNRYLSSENRLIAPSIYQQLGMRSDAIRSGSSPEIECQAAKEYLTSVGFLVDYFAYVDNATLNPLKDYMRESSLICAARLGYTRLIDNVQVD